MEAITQSMLGMFLRCSHQFERRYLRGEIIPPGIAARRGSATHKAAQINLEQKLHSQADLPEDDLQDAARVVSRSRFSSGSGFATAWRVMRFPKPSRKSPVHSGSPGRRFRPGSRGAHHRR